MILRKKKKNTLYFPNAYWFIDKMTLQQQGQALVMWTENKLKLKHYKNGRKNGLEITINM